ncbi:class F sortase [Streptomyces sp. NPDC091281]|uniref:class F sortase n=1 Tax=Streptomyces sp. NPDC091281 TaxID=3365985 RepID=UPI00382A38D0
MRTRPPRRARSGPSRRTGGGPSRRALRAALALAVAAAVVSAVVLVRAWTDAGRAPQDFGGGPASPAATAPSTGASPAPRAPVAPAAPSGSGTTGPAEPARTARPVSLALPRLGVRAPVDPVGVAPDGQMQVPGDPRRVGWYRFSPPAGATAGSTVLVGHVDARDGSLGVLVALADVRRGDTVRVGRADGTSVAFEVVSRRTVAKEALAATDVFRRDGPGVLRLVTCTGPYVRAEGGYRDNLVVTAEEAGR